jgi:arylsulfatase A-like enzyme
VTSTPSTLSSTGPLRAARLALAALLAVACRGSEEPAPRSVAPGATLFDALENLAVADFPASQLPAEMRAPAGEVLRTLVQSVAPEEWHDAGPAPDRPGEHAWGLRPRLRLDLELGRPWLEHDGRVATPRNFTPRLRFEPGDVTGWKDPETGQFFSWDRGRGALFTQAPERPGPVRFGYELGPLSPGRCLEPVLRGLGAPADARALARRATLAAVDRPALLVGTPSRLVTEVELDGVDELRVAVGLLGVGFTWERDQLVRTKSRSDGVTFRVRVGDELLWSLSVAEPERWHEATLDLARFRGQRVRLTLETEPGPGGDARDDYALWSGLSFHGAPRRAPAYPHVVLIDVDTLRADRLGLYGAARPTSPRIDAWAAREAIVYEDALSSAAWTLPSTVSMLTGLAVSQHEVRFQRLVLAPELEPVAVRLRAAGYATLARTDGGIVSAAFGFAHGFELFDATKLAREEFERVGWAPELERIRARRSERPLFVFLQTYQVHEPYAPDRRFEDPSQPYGGRFAKDNALQQHVESGPALAPDDWRWLNDTYDAGVRRMDDVVGSFLEGLDEAFGGEPYLVILTSDHGEELGERGRFGHGHTLDQELLHVPLVVRFPGGARGVRETRPVSSLDLVPTILAAAGLEAPAHLPGRALQQELPAQRLRVAEHADEAFATDFDGWKLLTGTITGYGGPSAFPRLLRPREDPLEAVDRAAADAARVQALEKLLREFLAQYPPRGSAAGVHGELDSGLVDELRGLGYVGDD